MKKNKNCKWKFTRVKRLFLILPVAILLIFSIACAGPLTMGRDFGNSYLKVKEGYHTKQDVVRIMGEPYKRETDPEGRQIYTYFWADGRGDGQKCVIVFNKKGEVMLKEVFP